MNKLEIFIIHRDWKGICLLDEITKKICRKGDENELGIYSFENFKLSITWDNWGGEDFYKIKDKEYMDIKIFGEYYFNAHIYDGGFLKKYLIFDISSGEYYSLEKNMKVSGKYVKNKNNKELTLITDNYGIITEKVFLQINSENYFLKSEYEKYFFEICVNDVLLLFNKKSKYFYDKVSYTLLGNYMIEFNKLILYYTDKGDEVYYINNLKKKNFNKRYENIYVLYPNNILLGERVLFSNISLCKEKIVLTSAYYIQDPWKINNFHFRIKNKNIVHKRVYENSHHYETSLSIILELGEIYDNILLEIDFEHNGNHYFYQIYLEQVMDMSETFLICGMTLFKDDYKLMRKYIDYYSRMGVNTYFFYYNDTITDSLLKEINELIPINVNMFLVEWKYEYWWNWDDGKRHHHAQMMAINDALHILKNYGSYIMYNDLDEYFLMEKYETILSMIEKNDYIDMYVFKNRFCKMGDELISFGDFYEEYDSAKIIFGNYWDSGREKNIVKIKNVNVMGVHGCYEAFSDESIITIKIDEFYHFVNFVEKERLILMSQYIS